MENIPKDILGEIFGHLPWYDDALSFALTHKRAYNLWAKYKSLCYNYFISADTNKNKTKTIEHLIVHRGQKIIFVIGEQFEYGNVKANLGQSKYRNIKKWKEQHKCKTLVNFYPPKNIFEKIKMRYIYSNGRKFRIYTDGIYRYECLTQAHIPKDKKLEDILCNEEFNIIKSLPIYPDLVDLFEKIKNTNLEEPYFELIPNNDKDWRIMNEHGF